MNLTVKTIETNQRRHHVRLEEGLMHSILAEAVARQMGIDLLAAHVGAKVEISHNYGSIGPTRYHADVTITEDFGPAGE